MTGESNEQEPPDLTRLTRSLRGPLGVIAVANVGLLFLAVFYTLYVGKEFFLPIVVAVLLSFLLAPAVRGLKRVGLPAPVGAGVMLVLFFSAAGYGTYRVWNPAIDWLERAPTTVAQAERNLRSIREPVEKIREAGEQVEAIAAGEQQSSRTADTESDSAPLGDMILEQARKFLVGGTVSVFLLYFLLALDDLFLRKLAGVLPNLSQRRKAVRIVRETERDLSHYVLIRTITNVGFGVAIGVAMWLLDMPNPVLWGILAGVLNYVPYLGGIVGYLIVGLVALTTFESTTRALVVPGVYVVLNVIEAYFITPEILGRELTLNPVMIFTWLIFWSWIWGVPGALLAVPLLAMTKIVADNVEVLRPLGAFLGR